MFKKISLFLILVIALLTFPVEAQAFKFGKGSGDSPNVFVYHIPEEDSAEEAENADDKTVSSDAQNQGEEKEDIISDDITADTSGHDEEVDNTESPSESFNEGYKFSDIYFDVLHGYAAYDEDADDVISLEDTLEVYQAIKIKSPGKVGTKKYAKGSFTPQNLYSSLNMVEYSIAPISGKSYAKKGGFSAGTMYDQGIDYAELEQSTGVFSRYESKYFAISTAYSKTVNSTNNNYNDNFYLAPELFINQYFSLREVLSTDITKNRKKFETILSINPFGKKDVDRLRFEFGAVSVYDDKNALLKNQFKFSTKFKL